MGENDEGRRQDGPVVEGHNQLIALELPHLVGDGLHLKEGVAVDEKRRHEHQVQPHNCTILQPQMFNVADRFLSRHFVISPS